MLETAYTDSTAKSLQYCINGNNFWRLHKIKNTLTIVINMIFNKWNNAPFYSKPFKPKELP